MLNPQIEKYKPSIDGYTLPCGFIDSDGVLHTDVQVSEMNGNTEEVLASRNMPIMKKLNSILAMCTKSIGNITDRVAIEQIVQDLTQGDRVFLLFAIRRVSLGDDMPLNAECPSCKKINRVTVNLADLDIKKMENPMVRTYEVILPKTKHIVSMKVMTGRGEALLTKASEKGENVISTAILARIDAVDGKPVNVEFIKGLPMADRLFLRSSWEDMEGGVDSTIEVTCGFCEKEYTTDVDMAAGGFFSPLVVLKAWKTK